MIAEAIKREVPAARNVSVDLAQIRWSDPVKNVRYIYFTPRICQIALIQYDRGHKPQPFTFMLRTAAQITRSHTRNRGEPKADNGKPAWRVRNKEQERVRRAGNANSKERRAAATAAITDPAAPLGSATLTKAGTVIGGRPPAVLGNIGKSRRFGLRQYIE